MRLWTTLLLISTLFAPTSSGAANPAMGQPLVFPETGHTLAYSFRVFWEQHGGLPIFGYPLTEVFVEAGQPVQYFERARLEWHGDIAMVLSGQLGRWAVHEREGEASFVPSAAPPPGGQTYFAETGHTLGGHFRDFWNANGGLRTFGFPLSQEFLEVKPEDGESHTVQYFERARFEWHPRLPPAQQVELGLLGREYLEREHPAPSWALVSVSTPEEAWNGMRPTRIRIPQIDLDTEVVEGGFSLAGWDVPRYTAVHYWPVAGFAGTAGNIIIAGHVGYKDTIFNHLPQVAVENEILLSTGQAVRRYRVTALWTLGPNDAWVMAPSGQEMLTLITCIPIGVYTQRLIVRAAPIEP